jgi:predicted DNA-binding transcriptional regulator YafY
MSQPDHFDPLELLTLEEMTEKTKRSRRSLYRDIDAGRLHVVHLGRRTMVPRAEAERYIYGDNTNGREPEE